MLQHDRPQRNVHERRQKQKRFQAITVSDLRVGYSCTGGKIIAIDVVTAVAWEAHTVAGLKRFRARLGELARHSPNLQQTGRTDSVPARSDDRAVGEDGARGLRECGGRRNHKAI